MTLSRESKVYVAGHTGLAGSAVWRRLQKLGYSQMIGRTSKELDLTVQQDVDNFFSQEKPEAVVLCAAKVGGILANSTYPASFIQQNLAIQMHVIHAAMLHGVKRLIFLGSSCIYPRDCPQPIKEECLLTGSLESTNRPYAVAKIAGIEMCWAYNRQYGTRFLCAMPTNLYGPGDSYDLQNSHVLPALIRKMHEAKIKGEGSVTLWGTGNPRREFLHSDDFADALTMLLELPNDLYDGLVNSTQTPPLINVGCGEDLPISQLANIVAEAVEFSGRIEWDTAKPDGTPRKLLDISRVRALGWSPKIPLIEGIKSTYNDSFLEKVLIL